MFSRNYFIFSRFVRKYNSIDQMDNIYYYFLQEKVTIGREANKWNMFEFVLEMYYIWKMILGCPHPRDKNRYKGISKMLG